MESDGLVGTDYFARFLVELNFERREMRLTPQPERPVNPQGYDRVLSPNFTQVFRFGRHLMLPARVNDSDPALFLIDTGAQTSLLDTVFAAEIAKVRRVGDTQVRGLYGKVTEVSEANQAVLQFASFRQKNIGLTAIDFEQQRALTRADGGHPGITGSEPVFPDARLPQRAGAVRISAEAVKGTAGVMDGDTGCYHSSGE